MTEYNNILNEKFAINNITDNILPSTKYEILIHTDDHNPPHFHFKSKTNTFELKIEIETLEIIHSHPRKGISKNNLLSWDGLTTERKALKKWLNIKQKKYDNDTNYTLLINIWNSRHIDSLLSNKIKNPWI